MKATLVLLHGAASNSTRWSEFAGRTRLRDRWKILRPDLRGNGAAAYPRTRPDVAAIRVPVLALVSTRSSFTDPVRTHRGLARQEIYCFAMSAACAALRSSLTFLNAGRSPSILR